MSRRYIVSLLMLAVLLVVTAALNIVLGTVDIPIDEVLTVMCGGEPQRTTWKIIILESRLPMVATASLAGAALAVAGLLLQTTFNNPLAGPSILGVSTGASLGVAIIMLSIGTGLGSMFGITASGYASILAGAFIGAAIILGILLFFSALVKSNTMLLIIGILVSYLTSSAISILNFFATQEGVHSYVIWGLGSFSGVSASQLPAFAIPIATALIAAMLMAKPLNALLLGSRYAESLGVNVKVTRNVLLAITGVLTAAVTAFCGPIGFLGLVVPHMARLLLNTTNHHRLLPITALCGAVVALLCSLICVLPDSGTLPINAITPVIGVPVILYVILNRRKIPYFN